MNDSQKDRLRQWITTVIVIVVNLVLALAHTNVPYAVAQQRPVMLGRYTDGQLTAMIIVWVVSIAVLAVTWTKKEKRRKKTIGIIAAAVSILLTVCVFDLCLRLVIPDSYIPEGDIYHREPNKVFTGTMVDEQPQGFSYPSDPPAYPPVEYTLTIDSRGFRNMQAADKCDILALGDSFVEGSEVSDDQTWVSQLGELTGKSVYNLGMSGEDPETYLATYEKIGRNLKPKTVLVMLYEGNDYREARDKTNPGFGERCRRFFKSSPLLKVSKAAMRKTFGPMCSRKGETMSETDPLWPVAWLPVGVGDEQQKFYAFKWKRVREHIVDEADFVKSDGYKTACDVLKKLDEKCKADGAKLVVLYAPDKPHVVLPAADSQNRLNKKQVAAFLKMKKAKDLPENDDECCDKMLASLGTQEKAVADFCKANDIEFVSLTDMLRKNVAAGRQMYFTYDQHWTPLGNQAVAKEISNLQFPISN